MQRSLGTLLRVQPLIRSLTDCQSGCRLLHVSSYLQEPGKVPATPVSKKPAVAAKVAKTPSSRTPTKAAATVATKGKAASKPNVAAPKKGAKKPVNVKAATKGKVAAPKKAPAKPVKLNLKKGIKTPSSIYFTENYGTIKASNPTKTPLEIFKMVNGQYAALTPDKKAPYIAKAEAYNAPIKQERLKERLASKKAPSAYAIFLKESFPKIKAQDDKASAVDIVRKTAELWKKASKDEKDSYTLKHNALKAKVAKQA